MIIKISLPTYVTFLRILALPMIVWCVAHRFFAAALMVYLGALLTDYLDGFLARRLQQESEFGKLLDHLTDKILVIVLFYYLCFVVFKTIAWLRGVALFFMFKDCLMLVGAAWLYVRYHHFFRPTQLSRSVGVGQMIMIALLLMTLIWPGAHIIVASLVWLTYLVQLLALWLLLGYVKKIYLFLKNRKTEQ